MTDTPTTSGWPTNLRLAWLTLGATAVVILQGAFVRATGSGGACGQHWPTCHGAIVPVAPGVETAIEFSHRVLSLGVLLLGAWMLRRAFEARRSAQGFFVFASLAFAFLLIEAALGALTVLWGITGDDATVARGIMVATHLVNSLLLVGALAGALVYARPRPPTWPLRLGRQGGLATVLGVGVAGMLVLMFSGGIAAMGTTMFPSESLVQGIAADLEPGAHPLVRLRFLHPLIAVSVGVYLFVALGLAWWMKPVAEARRWAQALFAVYLVQLGVGALNLALLAPLALQVLHLGLAVLAFGLLAAVSVLLLGAPIPARAPHLAAGAMEHAS